MAIMLQIEAAYGAVSPKTRRAFRARNISPWLSDRELGAAIAATDWTGIPGVGFRTIHEIREIAIALGHWDVSDLDKQAVASRKRHPKTRGCVVGPMFSAKC